MKLGAFTKKIICIGMACLSLCGCANTLRRLNGGDPNAAAKRFSADFTATADISFGESSSKAQLERAGDMFSMRFCGEDALNGMAFTLNTAEKTMTAEFNGVKVSLPGGTKAAAEVLCNILDTMKSAERLRVWESDGALIAAENDSDKFFVTADINTYNMMSIAVPPLDLEVNFTEFEYR